MTFIENKVQNSSMITIWHLWLGGILLLIAVVLITVVYGKWRQNQISDAESDEEADEALFTTVFEDDTLDQLDERK